MNIKKLLSIICIAILLILFTILIIKLNKSYKVYIYERDVTPTPLATRNSVSKIIFTSNPLETDNTPSPTTILIRTGNAGEHVKKIQLRLLELGFYTGNLDGQFGPETKNAIIWFQQQHNINSDGIIGPESYNTLFSDKAEKAKATPPPSPSEQKQ